MSCSILCYGVIGVDRLIRVTRFPERDGHARVLEEAECIGGEAANTAVSLCGLGHRVGLAGNVIGGDTAGLFLRSELQRVAGLDLTRLEMEPDRTTGHAVILSDLDGARTILGAFPDLTAPPLRGSDLKGVHLLSVDPFLGDVAVDAAKLARSNGLPVVSIELTAEHPLSEFADVVINSSGFMRRHEIGEPDRIARDLLSVGAGTFILTRGAEGCVVYTGNDRVEVPAFDVDVVDTTGAGDSFRAGLIHGILTDEGMMQSVRIGSAAAAITCCEIGGCGHIKSSESVLARVGRA
jgi:ribokinase/sulfofructose kinase